MNMLTRRAVAAAQSLPRNLASTTAKDYEITDQPEDNMFTMKLDNTCATVEYKKEGDVYDLIHSAVPDEFQGKGLGKVLAEKTFDYIADNDLRMTITCEFLQSYYKKNESKYKQYFVKC